jgi:translation initiation factor IF-2
VDRPTSSAPRKATERDREAQTRDTTKAKPAREGDGRRGGKLTLNDALTGREGGRQRSMASP